MDTLLKKSALVMLAAAMSLMALASSAAADEIKPQVERSHIDLVIALDTSNSMDGLIDAARQKIWDLVNEMATARPTPILRVGLISFGNDGYQEAGWTRVDQPLTDDLDAIYEKLMALKTNGGTEYVGRAIFTARTKMDWRKDAKALKLIFVAGNEGADQDFEHPSVKEAGLIIAQDIVVNTIYCGTETDSDAKGWRDVAQRADGQFANIAPDGGAVVIETPFDDRLGELSSKLNTTYVAYGARGEAAKESQMAMDDKAADMSRSAGAARAAAKGSALYRNSKWDLVDALDQGEVDLDEVAVEDLPDEMKGMKGAEREAFIKEKAAEREAIQKEIAALNVKRNEHIQKELKKKGGKKDQAFDAAVSKALRSQAGRKGISFE